MCMYVCMHLYMHVLDIYRGATGFMFGLILEVQEHTLVKADTAPSRNNIQRSK